MLYQNCENISPIFFFNIVGCNFASIGSIRHTILAKGHTPSLRSIRTTGNETVCFPEMETKPREVVVLGFVDNTALVKKGPNGITSLLPLSPSKCILLLHRKAFFSQVA